MNTNATYTYGMLNSKQLKCDPAYQRELDSKKIYKILDKFNPLRVNVVKVSHRDDAYWIFDGQHTTAALVAHNGGKDLMVECKIYEGLSQQDEAELFARQKEFEKRPGVADIMKALYASGDTEMVELKKLVESAGFIFDFSKSKANNRIVCCDKIYKIYRNAKQNDFVLFLRTLKTIWNGKADSLTKEIVGGLWEFCRTYWGTMDTDTLVKKLGKVEPSEIIAKGKALKDVKGDKRYAFPMVDIYNSRLKTTQLEKAFLLV